MYKRNRFYSIEFFVLLLLALFFSTETTAATRTWDGGGADNQWSTAANWSGNIVPTAADDVVFDATSVKNATVDAAFTVNSLAINIGYAGTITQNADLIVNSSFVQSAGAFQGGASNLTLSSLSLSGGAFAGGSGLISGGFGSTLTQSGGAFSSLGDVSVFSFSLSGGTFNAPNGTLTVVADFTHTVGGAFNAGTGTVKFSGYSVYNCANSMTVNVNETEIFNNLQFDNQACNARYVAGGDTLIVSGDFRLSNGSVSLGRVRPLDTITIDASFQSGGSTVVELVAPNKNFVINNPASTVSMLPIEMNAANSTLTSSGAGKINFYGMTFAQGTINQAANIWDFSAYPGYTQSGGIFNGSAAQLNISDGAATGKVLTGGNFNGGTGLISGGFAQSGGTFSTQGDMFVPYFALSGGTFNATSGTMSVGNFIHAAGGTFNAGTGTVQTSPAPGTYGIYFDVNASETFYHLRFNGTYNNANHVIAAGDAFVVNGTLTFNGRGVSGGSIVANGNVSYLNYGAYQNGTTVVKFEDAATRTVTLCGDAATCGGTYEAYIQPTIINNPSITINAGLTANGSMNFNSLILQRGVFNQGDGRVSIATYTQSGGTYNGGTFSEAFGSLNSFADFTLSGGDFNAAPSMSFTGNFTHTAASGNFNEGAGTVYFYSTFFGINGTVDVNGAETFHNVAFYSGNGTNIAAGDRLITTGTTMLRGGTINGGTIEAKGDVNVSRANVGGSFQGGDASVIFSGATDQTFSNPDGFPSFGGMWTINKPNSTPVAADNFAPAAPTTLLLGGNVGRGLAGNFPPFTVVSGNVVQTGAYDHYFGSLTLASDTNFVNEFGGSITLAGDVKNDGIIHLNGNGAGCQADSILLRSSSAAQRNWAGNGVFELRDVDVSGQTGTAIIKVYSGTDSGNNGANWIFDASCFIPTAAGVSISGRITTSNGRGIPRVAVILTDAGGNSRAAMTNPFGYYRFAEVEAGQTTTVAVRSKQYEFASGARALNVFDNLTDINFIAERK